MSQSPSSLAATIDRVKSRVDYYSAALVRTLHLRYRLVNWLCGSLPEFASGVVRGRLYRLAGFKIAPGAFIMGNLTLTGSAESFYDRLEIGPGAVVGDHVTINLDASVYMGRNVSLGPRVLIYTASHQIGPGSNRRMSAVLARPVRIEDGCWIGLAAIILPGVTVGRGSVVAAGTVVTQDVPANSYVEGNPGRVVQQLPWGNR